MAQQISASDRADLRAMITGWCKTHCPPYSVAEAEELAQNIAREVAQAVVETSVKATAGRASYQGSRLPCACGQQARFVNYRQRWVRTLCGDVAVKRAYYHCQACRRGRLPWDEAQGLGERVWSPGVKALVTEICASLPYGEATALLERAAGLRLEESSAQEIVREVGERLREADEAQIAAHCERYDPDAIGTEAAPQRLYVSMDAAKAHTGGEWHDIKVGALYAGERDAEGIDRARTVRYVARQERSETFGRRVYVEALKVGLERAERVIVLGDGAEWIWNEAQMHFPGCVEILDYYHACQHIWQLAHVLYGEGNVVGRRWAKEHCATLKRKGPDSLIRALRRRTPRTPEQREAIRLKLQYFNGHRHRMRYPQFRKQGLMIGSGPVEAGCKVVVGQRLKQAGMRWTVGGADAVLAVRAAVLNKQHARISQLCWAA